jgi:hypothetical protein
MWSMMAGRSSVMGSSHRPCKIDALQINSAVVSLVTTTG